MESIVAKASRKSRPGRSETGFTLVELLVVIGIIALLISILLPALNNARRAANTTKCLANIRTLSQAFRLYATENRDSLPWAIYTRELTVVPPPAVDDNVNNDAVDSKVYTWWSVMRGTIRKNGIYDNSTSLPGGGRTTRFMEFFECSVANRRDLGNDFGANPILFPTESEAKQTIDSHSKNYRVTRPAKFGQLYPDTILIYDAAEVAPNYSTQYLHGYDLDGGNLSDSKKVTLRYRELAQATYEVSDPDYYQYGNDAFINPGVNKDVGAPGVTGQNGNVRWRHGKNDQAVFTFADGSAKTMRITKDFGKPNASGEVYRKLFRPKLPAGFATEDE